MRAPILAVFAIMLASLTGCGTIYNLKDPAEGPMFLGSGVCYPFGGVVRSGLLATIGTPSGVVQFAQGNVALATGKFSDGLDKIGGGLWITAAGLGAIVDTPLSLAGDVVTFPLAYGRSRRQPWATWWGTQGNVIELARPTVEPSERKNETAD